MLVALGAGALDICFAELVPTFFAVDFGAATLDGVALEAAALLAVDALAPAGVLLAGFAGAVAAGFFVNAPLRRLSNPVADLVVFGAAFVEDGPLADFVIFLAVIV